MYLPDAEGRTSSNEEDDDEYEASSSSLELERPSASSGT
eukprot:CAMPEP_0178988318 /NCGR_PEP_ID=MMETSP0795-20121207/3748_1 /TAXON_ID=88552 /ORGANISM="Amoebophrya sp., Strain Ameob2" /LENGTH=38 /DNA_ID= /DNA_START= /DNA_END= /DNA_ORIENTATION=